MPAIPIVRIFLEFCFCVVKISRQLLIMVFSCEQPHMEFKIIHRLFQVGIMYCLAFLIQFISPILHIRLHSFPSGRIKQQIIICHLPHPVTGIKILNQNSFQRRIPDPLFLHIRNDLGPFCIKQHPPADGKILCMLPLIPVFHHLFRMGRYLFQCHGDHRRHLVGMGHFPQRLHIHGSHLLGIRRRTMHGTCCQITKISYHQIVLLFPSFVPSSLIQFLILIIFLKFLSC